MIGLDRGQPTTGSASGKGGVGHSARQQRDVRRPAGSARRV